MPRKLFYSIIFAVLVTIDLCHAQQTNLLQRYIKQYFKDYFPSTVRSYTLYGNGQNGAADFHAGLPFAFEKSGRVQSLVYSTSANPPPLQPQASSRATNGLVESAWVYPGLQKATYSASNYNPNYINSRRSDEKGSASSQHIVVPIEENLPSPTAVTKTLPGPEPVVAESRMEKAPMFVKSRIPMVDILSSDNQHVEIPVQSSMTY